MSGLTSRELDAWLRRKGRTKAQFIEWLDISPSTFYRWQEIGEYPRYVEIVVKNIEFQAATDGEARVVRDAARVPQVVTKL
jgi:hypothetical protein